MFWGCYSIYHGKGLHLVWKKEWGNINAEAYRRRIVPLVADWHQEQQALHPELPFRFQHDNAPGHRAIETRNDILLRGIPLLQWPPNSPDLNPIEAIWDKMKDWIDENYPEAWRLSKDELERIVYEAWDAIDEMVFRDFVLEVRGKMRRVFFADGGHIHG